MKMGSLRIVRAGVYMSVFFVTWLYRLRSQLSMLRGSNIVKNQAQIDLRQLRNQNTNGLFCYGGCSVGCVL